MANESTLFNVRSVGNLSCFSCPFGPWIPLWNSETIRESLVRPN